MQRVGNMKFATTYEEQIFNEAVQFVAVRGSNSRNRTRQEFSTFEAAKQCGAEYGDNRTMVYAVNKHGSAAHICNA